MNNIKKIILFVVFITVTQASYAKFYRWVDENGKVHYSDKLPAERARGAHEQLNETGVPTKAIDRDKTDAERAAEKIESEKLANERREKAAIEARQRAKDKILLDIFTSERDLIYTRDDRLTSIESLINLTELNNKRLEERLKVSTDTQARLLKDNKKVPETIIEKINSIQGQIDKNNNYIASQNENYEKTKKDFEADLLRYRELKSETP